MQVTTVNQLQTCRSGSTLVDKEEKNRHYSDSNSFCEVIQSQRILKEAKAFLDPFENRSKRASKAVKKVFTVEKLANVIHRYKFVINKKEQPLTNVYDILCDPCFFLPVYQRIKNDAAAGVYIVEGSNVTLSGLRFLSKELKSEQCKCLLIRRV